MDHRCSVRNKRDDIWSLSGASPLQPAFVYRLRDGRALKSVRTLAQRDLEETAGPAVPEWRVENFGLDARACVLALLSLDRLRRTPHSDPGVMKTWLCPTCRSLRFCCTAMACHRPPTLTLPHRGGGDLQGFAVGEKATVFGNKNACVRSHSLDHENPIVRAVFVGRRV